MRLFFYYFLIFFIYSFFGWIIETINCSILAKKKVLNRGFLIGPYIPIYGVGSLIMILSLVGFRNNPIILFSLAVIYCSLVEYLTSYVMEKLFSARWWDYTHEKFNINGRVCLKNSLLFGVLGVVLLYIVHPFIELLLLKLSSNMLITVSYIVFVIFFIDFFVTLLLLSKLDIQVKNIKSDATEEIDKEIKQLMEHYRILYKRLFSAFPRLEFNLDSGNILVDRIRKQFDDFDNMLSEKRKEISKIKKEKIELKSNLK